jgi:outer membrane protein assembly factor BamB
MMSGLCSSLLAAAAAAADGPLQPIDNWHQWRGPLASGVALKGDPPTKWDEKTNIKWKVAIPGRGFSTPIVWGDRIFLQTAIDTGRAADAAALPKADPALERKTTAPSTFHQFIVMCLSRTDGKVLWQRVAAEEVPHEGHHPTHSYAAFSPTTDGRHVYASFGSRGVYCYDLEGKLQWKRDLGRLNTRYGWGEGASPALHKDTLVVNGAFACAVPLDARGDVRDSDKLAWVHKRGTPYVPSPLLVGERLFFTMQNTGLLSCLDLRTGKAILDRRRLPAVSSVYGSPIAAAGRIYLVDRDGTGLVLKQGDTLEVLAVNHLDDHFDASPAVAGRQLFLRGEKHLYCIDANPAGR